MSGAHPDLTWVVPSGAHEILVSDIDQPVISAASKTPFESSRRVFVIERADELGDEAANRMLKTLEEPAAFVHLILLTDRLGEILPTIRSRCQTVRFEAPSEEAAADAIQELGVPAPTALACVRLALQDADRAQELASAEGQALRAAAERYARAAIGGDMVESRPWSELLTAVRARGEATGAELEAHGKPPNLSSPRARTASALRPNGLSASAARGEGSDGRAGPRVCSSSRCGSPTSRLRPTAPESSCATATGPRSCRRTPAVTRRGCGARSSWWRTLGSASCLMCRRIWHARPWRTA